MGSYYSRRNPSPAKGVRALKCSCQYAQAGSCGKEYCPTHRYSSSKLNTRASWPGWFVDEHMFGALQNFLERFVNLSQEQVFRTLKSPLKTICQRTLRRQVTSYISFTTRPPIREEFTPEESEGRLCSLVSGCLQPDNLQALPARQRSLMTLVLHKLLAFSTFVIAGELEALSNRESPLILQSVAQPS